MEFEKTMKKVRSLLKEINQGGYWPYAPNEDWEKEQKAIIKTGKAFIKALESVHDPKAKWLKKAKRRFNGK
jgi:hypothetical protein